VQISAVIRYALWAFWFVLVPAACACLLVITLQDAGGIFAEIGAKVRDQRVPAGIVLFTVAEMTLYYFRHQLPFARHLNSSTQAVPAALLQDVEAAKHLVDEASRIFERNEQAIAKELATSVREKIQHALADLQTTLETDPFPVELFRERFDLAHTLVDQHLAPWRKSEVREYVESIAVAVLIALTLRSVVVEAFKIPSGSMLPTLQIDDHIFVNKFVYGPTVPLLNFRVLPQMPPNRADVIVFVFPDPEPGHEGQDFIKRVIALPGDTLEAEYGHPIINGWKVPSCRVGLYRYGERDGHSSPYGELFVEFLGDSAHLTLYEQGNSISREGPFYVGPDEVYVMGDNRNNSHDSRRWRGGEGGGVPYGNIQGRAMNVWLPFSRFAVSVMGHPTVPKGMPPELTTGIEKCLSERPSNTTPPPPDPSRRLR
jgi:signal peptidase I